MEAATNYAKSGDLSIAYQVHGEGPLDLIFVPGFVSHVDFVWELPSMARFLRRLASFSRLIIFDKRGQGLSDRPPDPPTLEESMDDVRAVMDAAGAERAAVFGISEGGPMSMLFAATYPDRVSSLVLFGTYARMVNGGDWTIGISDEALDRWVETVQRDWGEPIGASLWAPSTKGDAEFEAWWGRLLRQGTSPAGAVALLNLYREIDVRGALSSIGVPTLVVHRSDDRIVRVAQGRYLAEHIPGARLVELPDGDVSGMAVNIGARIGALAGSEEVLVSSTVRELVVGSGLEFTDRGSHTLKGAPGDWHLFAVAPEPEAEAGAAP